MVVQIYPTELQLNKANSSDTEAPFLDLNLSITNGVVSSKINDKRDDFNFEMVNIPFFDGDVPRSSSYGVYISQLIRFARVCSNVDDFNNRNLFLTAQLLKKVIDILKFENNFLTSTWSLHPYLLGYILDIMRQSACLVLNPITVYSYGFLFHCKTVGQASDTMTALT